jgi:uncharacterized BrkB/YihY/UPF0761 family membrane protein
MYAANFGTFNKTYGSLGAVIGFMTWIWLSTIVVLIGGKLNAEIERPPAQPPCRPNGGERLQGGTTSGRSESAHPRPGARAISKVAETSPETRGASDRAGGVA